MTTRVALAVGAIVTAVAIAACSGATTVPAATTATSTVAISVAVPNTPPAARPPVTQPPANGGAPAAAIVIPVDVDPADPGAVALAATITIATSDTSTDTDPGAALRRAAPWIDPHLLADMLNTPTSSSGTWLALSAHHGYTHVTAQLANEYGQPADTAADVYETVSYTVQTPYRDGATPPAPAGGVMRLHLTRCAGGWHVSAFLP